MPLRERDEDLLKPVKPRDPEEEAKIGKLAAFCFVEFFLVCAILVCGWLSFTLLRFEFSATSEPVDVNLNDLENGEKLPSSYIQLSPHIALHEARIGEFYPVVSLEDTNLSPGIDVAIGSPIGIELQHLEYRTRAIKMLVLEQEIASGLLFGGQIQGMVIGTADQLADDRVKKLEKLGVRDPARVYLLIPGRRPNIWPGVILGLLAIGLVAPVFFIGKQLLNLLGKFGYD